jgi:hypothetical protein
VSKRKKRKVSCKACGRTNHELSRCFYAFLELRFKGFKPDDALVEKAAQALKDITLDKEVETLRKRKGKLGSGREIAMVGREGQGHEDSWC